MKYAILAVCNSPETLEDTRSKYSMSQYVLKIVFQRYVQDCSIGEMIGFWMSLVLIHALFLWVYYKKGHPYKVVLGGKQNRKSKCTGNETNNQDCNCSKFCYRNSNSFLPLDLIPMYLLNNSYQIILGDKCSGCCCRDSNISTVLCCKGNDTDSSCVIDDTMENTDGRDVTIANNSENNAIDMLNPPITPNTRIRQNIIGKEEDAPEEIPLIAISKGKRKGDRFDSTFHGKYLGSQLETDKIDAPLELNKNLSEEQLKNNKCEKQSVSYARKKWLNECLSQGEKRPIEHQHIEEVGYQKE